MKRLLKLGKIQEQWGSLAEFTARCATSYAGAQYVLQLGALVVDGKAAAGLWQRKDLVKEPSNVGTSYFPDAPQQSYTTWLHVSDLHPQRGTAAFFITLVPGLFSMPAPPVVQHLRSTGRANQQFGVFTRGARS